MTDRQFVPPPVAVSLAGALVLYAILWPIVMQDVGNAYVPWLKHIVDLGPLHAFATPFADYNPPYLYLLALVSPLYDSVAGVSIIKLLSVGGTVALAVAVACLLRTLGIAHAWRWAALIGVLPTTVLNAALLGQCDAFYAAPCIMALDAAIARRNSRMLLWCGVALAFKLQAILFAPFVIAVLIQRRVPLSLWLIVPGVFLLSLAPAWLLGWPAADLLSIYYRQSGYMPLLPSLNAPNIWFLAQQLVPQATASLSALALAGAVGATGWYIARASATMPSGRGLLPFATLAVLLTAGLLPHMHERYFFVADIVSFAWAVTAANRRVWNITAAIQLGSAFAVGGYLFDSGVCVLLGFAAMATATWMIAEMLVRPAANDNPLMARAC